MPKTRCSSYKNLNIRVICDLFSSFCVFSVSRPQNLIAQSQSGTGKTAAFSLAMLSHVNPANKWTQVSLKCNLQNQPVPCFTCRCWNKLTFGVFFFFQCLCIAPTYELALQIGQVIEQMGKFCPDVKLAYGIRGNRSKNVTCDYDD